MLFIFHFSGTLTPYIVYVKVVHCFHYEQMLTWHVNLTGRAQSTTLHAVSHTVRVPDQFRLAIVRSLIKQTF